MSEFSDVLEQHILLAKLSESQLAQATGFSRSYIARLKNGQRISPDTEKMTKLFEILNLTAEEYSRLWNLYLEERLGKEQYGLTRKMLDFISCFHHVSHLKAEVRLEYSMPEVRLVEGNADLQYMIRIVIEQEAVKPDCQGHVRLFLQPECQEAMEALKSGFKLNQKFLAEHIVCLEKEEKIRNIGFLQKIVPVILCQGKADYRVYYYYDRISAHFSSFSPLPYFIITSDCVLNMDYEFEHGIIYREPEIRKFFENMFDRMIEKCPRLCEYLTGEDELLEYYLRPKKTADHFYSIGNQPCIGLLDAAQEIDRYMPKEMRHMAELLKDRLKSCRETMLRDGGKAFVYFTDEGIRMLMEEGKIEELPGNMILPLKSRDRRRVIENILEETRMGFYEPHLIQKKKYRYPKELMINVYDFDDVMICYYGEGRGGCLVIREGSLARLFYDFLRDFHESAYVCTVEESVDHLKEYLRADTFGEEERIENNGKYDKM